LPSFGLEGGDMPVVVDGKPEAPAVLLIQNAAAPMALLDLVARSRARTA
jgi:hypothetical protein